MGQHRAKPPKASVTREPITPLIIQRLVAAVADNMSTRLKVIAGRHSKQDVISVIEPLSRLNLLQIGVIMNNIPAGQVYFKLLGSVVLTVSRSNKLNTLSQCNFCYRWEPAKTSCGTHRKVSTTAGTCPTCLTGFSTTSKTFASTLQAPTSPRMLLNTAAFRCCTLR